MSEYQLELWKSILVCCVGDSLTHICRGSKKSEWFQLVFVKVGPMEWAQECLWTSVSSGFSPAFGWSLCAWLLQHRRSSSWKPSAEGSCTNSLILLRSCPFNGPCSPDAAELVQSLCMASTCSSKASASQWAWQHRSEDGLVPKAGRHMASCLQEILWLCAALLLLEPPPLQWQPLPSPPWQQPGNLWCITRIPGHVPYGTILAAVPYSPCTLALRSEDEWGCSWVNFSAVCISQQRLGLLPLSLLPT